METLRRFRLMAVRGGIGLTMLAGFGTYLWLGPVVGKSVLAGGIAGVLSFWILAIQAEKLASASRGKTKALAYKWTFLRMGFYAVVLVWAYRLDPGSPHGILGAAGGLLIIRFVVLLLGITGFDLKEERDADGTHR